jgi:hypothetical protein
MYDDENCGDWKDVWDDGGCDIDSDNARYDDINSWDGSRSF